MLLGKVVGTVVATKKVDSLQEYRLLLVQMLGDQLKPLSSLVVCIDAVGAGLHEVVLVTQGSSARQTAITQNKPVDGVIVGIVDQVAIDGSLSYNKDNPENT